MLRAYHISAAEGLPKYENFTTSLDTQGFIWVSFRESFSRYDGYDFKTYDRKNLNAQLDKAYFLSADKSGKIWFWCSDDYGERQLVNILNPATGSYLPLEEALKGQAPFKAGDVHVIVPKSRAVDDLCIILRDGSIYFYNGSFVQATGVKTYEKRLEYIKAGSSGDSQWVAFNDSLFQFSADGSLRSVLPLEDGLIDISMASDGSAIYLGKRLDNPSARWVSLWLRKAGASFRRIQLELPVDVLPGSPRAVIAGENGLFWYFCNELVCVLDEDGRLLAWQRLQVEGHLDYSPQVVRGFLQNDDILWINTYEGMFKAALLEKPFQNFLPGRSCRGIFKHGDSLFVNSYQGDAIIDLKGNYLRQSIGCSPFGYGFALDEDQNLWIGNEAPALCRRDMRTGRTQQVDLSGLPLVANPLLIYPLAGTRSILLGSQRGLFKLETRYGNMTQIPGTGEFPELQSAWIRHFHKNEEGIWLATSVGLFLLDPQCRAIRKADASELEECQPNFIHEDKEGLFWLATRENGLIRWNRKDDSFKVFDTSNGLSNNNIHCIYEDGQGKLWMSSNHGLMRFDKKTYNVNTFLIRDGLPQNEFNFASHFRDETGRMYFGGLNGVTAFYPSELEREQSNGDESRLVFTSLSVLNAETGEWMDRSLDIVNSNRIVLDPDEKYADLKFSLLDFTDPVATRYAWKIEGFLDDWVYQTENSIKISQLPVGRYILRLKAQGSSGRWSASELTIPVEIVAPFYHNWWFYLALGTSVTGLIYLFMRWKNENLNRERLRLEAEVNRRTAIIENKNRDLEEINAYKDRLIGMIAHDLRVPALSFRNVAGKVSYLIEKGQTDMLIRLGRSIEANAGNLNHLLDNLLNWVVSQRFSPNLQPEWIDAGKFLEENIELFKIHLDDKHISIQKDIQPGLELVTDRGGFGMILRNILSNAVKFTGEGGQIRVLAYRQSGLLVVKVADNGIGMQAEHLEKLFALKSKSQRGTVGEPGTGIGLLLVKNQVELLKGDISIKSEPMGGTTVRIFLPIGAFSAEEETVASVQSTGYN